MTTRTRKANVSLLDDRIDILNRNAVDASPAKQIFRTVSATLALVRDKMIDDKDSVQLSEYCFSVCDVLKTAIQGRDGLDESVRVALEDLERVTREIERTLRRGVNIPRTKRNKGRVEGQKLKIQEIFDTLNAPSAPLPVDSRGAATTSKSESACGRLVRRAFTPHELPSLIEVIFSSQDESDTIRRLLGDNVQAFVDVMDEALDRPDLSPQTRENCLRTLCKMCGRHALLPTTLKTPVSFERTGNALFRGGFADVWKGEHCGQDVAVKVIRIYSDSELQRVIGRFCKEAVVWKALRHPNVLPLIGVTTSETQFAMISDWMANGNINDFVKANPDANQLELLRDVARGLIYIHSQGMIHGDLKGANILIDQIGCARLADFGLLTIISDPKYLLSSSSHTQGGTVRWMSPERIAPEQFGFKNSRPTISSDCYALGMVIYETISGNVPFHKDTDLTVFLKVVVKGEHPPQGVKFVKSLWGMLERCWASGPNDRPSIKDVLRCLEMVPNSSEPHSPGADEGMDKDGDEAMDEDGDDWDSGMNSSGSGSDDFFTTNDRAPIPIFFPRPPAPDSFALPSNHSGRKWSPEREEECSFCQGNDNRNKQGQPELMVTCVMCGRSSHPTCMDLEPVAEMMHPWNCIECKTCGMCNKKGDDACILICDFCGRGWHMDCLEPPLEDAPTGKWRCYLCPSLSPPAFFQPQLPPELQADSHPEHNTTDQGSPSNFQPIRALSVASTSYSHEPQTRATSGRKGKGKAIFADESEIESPLTRGQRRARKDSRGSGDERTEHEEPEMDSTPRAVKRMKLKLGSRPPQQSRLVVRLKLPRKSQRRPHHLPGHPSPVKSPAESQPAAIRSDEIVLG